MPWKRHHYGPKFWGAVIALCVLAALATIGVNRFIESFYSYEPQHYEPKETTREELLKKQKAE
jgi:hypothetical protein